MKEKKKAVYLVALKVDKRVEKRAVTREKKTAVYSVASKVDKRVASMVV